LGWVIGSFARALKRRIWMRKGPALWGRESVRMKMSISSIRPRASLLDFYSLLEGLETKGRNRNLHQQL
jgi:hypothetical protein